MPVVMCVFVELPESDPSGGPVDIYTVLGSVDRNPIPLTCTMYTQ